MTSWLAQTYGSPCGQCGFSWSTSPGDCRALVLALPERLEAALTNATGAEICPELAWNVTAYVAHIGDNLRIWAERLAGVCIGASARVGRYDEAALAEARNYRSLSLQGALWSLGRAVRDWNDAVAGAGAELTLVHPDRGEITLDELVLGNTHDVFHHEWDIDRCLASNG